MTNQPSCKAVSVMDALMLRLRKAYPDATVELGWPQMWLRRNSIPMPLITVAPLTDKAVVKGKASNSDCTWDIRLVIAPETDAAIEILNLTSGVRKALFNAEERLHTLGGLLISEMSEVEPVSYQEPIPGVEFVGAVLTIKTNFISTGDSL